MRPNILVPIDFTKIAETGLATAVNIAKQKNAKIYVLHVIDEQTPDSFRPDADLQAKHNTDVKYNALMVELIDKRKRQLSTIVGRYGHDKVEIRPVITVGKFREKLDATIDKNSVDLIVMGTSGETSISEFFTGNHTSQTIRVAGKPVLAVKEHLPITKFEKILLLIDLKSYKKQIVKLIKDFINMFDMEVIIAHVKQNKDVIEGNIIDNLEAFAKENKFKNYSLKVIGKGEKVEKVSELADQIDFDLIATISEGSSGLIRLFFGSYTEKLLNKLDKPLLSISE